MNEIQNREERRSNTLLKYKIKQMTFHLNMFSKAIRRKVEIRSSSYITHLPLCNIESVSHVCKSLFSFYQLISNKLFLA